MKARVQINRGSINVRYINRLGIPVELKDDRLGNLIDQEKEIAGRIIYGRNPKIILFTDESDGDEIDPNWATHLMVAIASALVTFALASMIL